MSKVRPSRQSAMPRVSEPVEATDLSATGRRTPTDQVRTRRRARSVPGVQRQERSTPTARLMSSGMKRSTPTRRTGAQRVKDQRQLQPPDLDRGRRATSNPPVRSALPTKDQRQLRFSSSTLVRDRGRANHPPVVPVQQGSRTQVSMVGNLGKWQTVKSLSPARDPQKRACEAPLQDCRQIVHKTSLATRRTRRPAIATTVRRSGAAEAQPFSALSACRRARSFAS